MVKLFQLSRRARRWVAHGIDRFRGRFYEGPQPPDLIKARVAAALQRFGGTSELEVVLTRLAENCYRDGYERGYEWCERDWPGPEVDPEALVGLESTDLPELHDRAPDWRSAVTQGFDPHSPLRLMTPEQRIQFAALMGAQLDFRAYESDGGSSPARYSDSEFELSSGQSPSKIGVK